MSGRSHLGVVIERIMRRGAGGPFPWPGARHLRGCCGADEQRRLNPCDPAQSVRFNPLHGVTEKDKALRIAHCLAECSGKAGRADSPFFRQQATQYMSLLILAVNRRHEGAGTFADIREIVDGGSAAVRELGEETGFSKLVQFANELDTNNNAQTSFAELSNYLLPWHSEELCAVTSESELDFDCLAREPAVLIVSVRETEARRMRPFLNLVQMALFDWAADHGHTHGGRLPRPLLVAIDELPALGKLIDLEQRLNTIRKRGVAVIACAQTISQIHSTYQDDAHAALAGFGSMVFVPPLAAPDADYAAQRSGTIEVPQVHTAASGAVTGASRRLRALLEASEVAAAARDEAGNPRLTWMLADTSHSFWGYLRKAPQISGEREYLDTTGPLKLPKRKVDPSRKTSAQAAVHEKLPIGISNVSGWSQERIRERLVEVKAKLDWDGTTGSARSWWIAFENENKSREPLILRLAEELLIRNATITEFFLAYVYSNTESIQGNLHYLDYTRIKKEHDKGKKVREAT